jgi:hypothetical protein
VSRVAPDEINRPVGELIGGVFGFRLKAHAINMHGPFYLLFRV